jgi:aromatic ring-cleaving dioxygenase
VCERVCINVALRGGSRRVLRVILPATGALNPALAYSSFSALLRAKATTQPPSFSLSTRCPPPAFRFTRGPHVHRCHPRVHPERALRSFQLAATRQRLRRHPRLLHGRHKVAHGESSAGNLVGWAIEMLLKCITSHVAHCSHTSHACTSCRQTQSHTDVMHLSRVQVLKAVDGVQVFDIVDRPIFCHPTPMFEAHVHWTRAVELMNTLTLHGEGLSALVHPNTRSPLT